MQAAAKWGLTMKPVFIINGFLESGKTEFILFTLSQPYFQIRGTTLLILCEEGETEYDEEILKKSHTIVEVVDEESQMVPAKLIELDKRYKPERVIIEYNGMWNFKNFKLPWHWQLEQQITTIDASTFQNYYTNMRSLLAEMLRKSELIIFNRCDGMMEQLSSFKRNVKAVNPQAEIVFEDKNGEINQAVAVSVFSHVEARRLKAPVTVFLIGGILPMVPGAGMYRTAYSIIAEDAERAYMHLQETLLIAGAIAVAIFMTDSIARIIIRRKG